jgi:hypothetical protein
MLLKGQLEGGMSKSWKAAALLSSWTSMLKSDQEPMQHVTDVL